MHRVLCMECHARLLIVRADNNAGRSWRDSVIHVTLRMRDERGTYLYMPSNSTLETPVQFRLT